jgi:hypothetical protein
MLVRHVAVQVGLCRPTAFCAEDLVALVALVISGIGAVSAVSRWASNESLPCR